ncbi:MAG: hypothetical protein ABIG11_06885 [bacterium]
MKKTAVFLILFALTAGAINAEEKAADKSGWKAWFQNTLKSLKSETGRRFGSRTVRVTAVAAVRGAEMDSDPMTPYWKGGITEKASKKLAAERDEFTKAVELILEGKTEDGEKALNAFKKNHPESSLLPDVKEALANIPKEDKNTQVTDEESSQKAESGGKK